MVTLMAPVDTVTHTLMLDMVIHMQTHLTIMDIHIVTVMDIPILHTRVEVMHIPTLVIPTLCYL